MNKHKYSSLVKFVHLDGIKEFKETDPSLFSKDGISTSTLEVEDDKTVVVTMRDVKNACEKYLNNEITKFQLQQWGEWIHMMDFFKLDPDGEYPNNDESLIDVLSDIDMLDLLSEKECKEKVKEILKTAEGWVLSH